MGVSNAINTRSTVGLKIGHLSSYIFNLNT